MEATNSEGHTALQCAIDTGFYSSPALITRLICEGAQVDERAARDALALQLTQSREYTTSFDRASWLYAPLLALFLAWRRSALPPLAAVLNLYGVPRDLLPHIVDSNIPLSPKLPSPLIEDSECKHTVWCTPTLWSSPAVRAGLTVGSETARLS